MLTRIVPPRLLVLVLVLVLFCRTAHAQESVALISPKDAGADWKFNNGQEFPGATGALTVDAAAAREGRPSLKLAGDFTKGGEYVELGRKIDGVDIRELSFWLRSPDLERVTLRLNDATGQTHQLSLKLTRGPDWQRVVLPLERFFARRGEADAVTNIVKYESWGGAKEGAWHGPATAIYILIGQTAEQKQVALWLNDVAILPRPREVPGAETKTVIALDEIADGAHDWRFTRGEEFPGAKGSLTVAQDGVPCLRLAGDFTGGGSYVAAVRELRDLDVKDVSAIRLRVKSENAAFLGVQLVDGSGQTHQRSHTKITPDGQWHELILRPAEIAGGEHWGGANDGQWHGPPTQIALNLPAAADEKGKQPVVLLADIRAEALRPVFRQPPAFKSAAPIVLERTLEKIDQPANATTPAFAVAPGLWEIALATTAALHSPDNSYNAVVQIESLDSAGQSIERRTVADVFGTHERQTASQRVEFPPGAATARFQIQLNKTYGRFSVDDISAAYLAPAPRRDDRIVRLLFDTAQLGNLLFPDDPRRVRLTLETRKPLRDTQRTVTCVVRDYWGAEQTQPMPVALGAAEKKDARYFYHADLDLGTESLEIGRYYELHAAIPQPDAEPFQNHTSFAILPEAATKKFPPAAVPFTARNWDNRLAEYVRLSDRLGIRICGIWGGWSAQPPYAAEAPALDLARKLDMGWLTNTPIATIELGKKDYDETALRSGVRNLIERFGKERPMFINLGNEPHGTGERVLANVAAYRAVYEEVKKIDPSIPVIATSVEPNEEYFRAGYGQWCDAFDFHIYETPYDVRRTVNEYYNLMKKYGLKKPIWSTELGLNSQGQTRLAVASDLVKKFATFFAAGGEKASWFGLLYPDPEGKEHGSSSDSHNVFDCRFNHYAPRLDAIAYYNMVNAIAVKKFVAERTYDDGINAFLFQDSLNHSLQILWKDEGRKDVELPLPGVEEVTIIGIDGRRRTLDAEKREITLTISEDPILLLYSHGGNAPPQTLGRPRAQLFEPPQSIPRGAASKLTVMGATAAEVEAIVPPFWTVEKSSFAGGGDVPPMTYLTLTPPSGSAVREADCIIKLHFAPFAIYGRTGELSYRAKVAE